MKFLRQIKYYLPLILCLLALVLPVNVYAVASETVTFIVAENFDATARSNVQGTLVKTSPLLYFYIEKPWWESQLPARQQEILAYLDVLGIEFSGTIYPTLTTLYGFEPKPGVDGDTRITIFFHALKDGAAGYFRSSDEYIKLQVPDSNEREMVYLSLSHLDSPLLKVFLAHEFTHMIEFNQKDKLQGVTEELWLNEARADYSSTILGYDAIYEGSNLQRRVRDFLVGPSDSLTEWRDSRYDYAVVNVFMQYLQDHYGISVLADSLKLPSVGISSLNEILKRNGAKENFAQIYTNWAIAILINDCSVSQKYCYLNKNLKNLRISPTLNFLPVSGDSSLSVTNVTKNWSGNWQKIIGGNGNLQLEFSSALGLSFTVPYLLFDKNNNYSVGFLDLIKGGASLTVDDFSSKYASLVLIPTLQSKIVGFEGIEFTYPYTFSTSVSGPVSPEEEQLIQALLAQIELLKNQIADLLSSRSDEPIICPSLNNNLYFGLQNKVEVSCLQHFLKNQGSSIYPEGLVTGNFGNLTRAAVIRFQKSNQIPATGYVGVLTRTKINELLQ